MNIDKKVSAKQGHPCTGCPYIFAGKRKGCIMGAVPGDCAWYFYKRLMGHSDAFRPVEEIQKQYWESVRKKSDAGKQLEKGMEMLLVTAEMERNMPLNLERKDMYEPSRKELPERIAGVYRT